jgi:hypothetical protein
MFVQNLFVAEDRSTRNPNPRADTESGRSPTPRSPRAARE